MFTNAGSDDWARMTDWVVEAYRDDTEELAWDLLLRGLGKEDLERELSMVLATPDSYPVTAQQVVVAVRASSAGVSPDDLDLDSGRLSFFLAAVAKG